MARLPTPHSDDSIWGNVLNDFLRVEHNEDGTLKSGGSLNAKADKTYVDAVLAQSRIFSHSITVVDPAVSTMLAWRAPYNCRVLRVLAARTGGTAATVNVRKNGAQAHLASDLSLPTTGSFTDGGSVQNTDYTTGDTLEILISGVTGGVTQLTIQADFTVI